MSLRKEFEVVETAESKNRAQKWQIFLNQNSFDYAQIQSISMVREITQVTDISGNVFRIDFENDRKNYHKKKSSAQSELLGRALGGLKLGNRVLDLSAGLGIDAVFATQLGFKVTAIERNPLIYLCLQEAAERYTISNLCFGFGSAVEYIKSAKSDFDVVYFDPMFPDKKKSALPRQEMVFFKRLVGTDEDAGEVAKTVLNSQIAKRLIVKRPLGAPELEVNRKPRGSIAGKLIRYDIYSIEVRD